MYTWTHISRISKRKTGAKRASTSLYHMGSCLLATIILCARQSHVLVSCAHILVWYYDTACCARAQFKCIKHLYDAYKTAYGNVIATAWKSPRRVESRYQLKQSATCALYLSLTFFFFSRIFSLFFVSFFLFITRSLPATKHASELHPWDTCPLPIFLMPPSSILLLYCSC